MKYSLTNKAIAMLLSVLMLFSIASTFAENFYNGSNIEPDEQLILSSPEPSNYPPVPYPTIPVPPPEHCEYYPNCECDYTTSDDCEILDCDCEGECECKDEGSSNEDPVDPPDQGEKGDTDDGCPYCECEADCPYCECGADCRGSPSLDADLAMTNHRNLMEAATTNDPPEYFLVSFRVIGTGGSLTANGQDWEYGFEIRGGTSVNFVASTNLGYIIQSWTIDSAHGDTLTGINPTAPNQSIASLSGPVDVTVTFLPVFPVYFGVEGTGGGLTANEQDWEYSFEIEIRKGAPVTFVATPDEGLGYIVQSWTINSAHGDTLTGNQTDTHRSIASLSGPVWVTVSFHRPERSLTFNTTHISGANRGDVNGSTFTSGGPVMSGSTIFFTACETFLAGRYAQWHTVPPSPTTRYGPTLSFTMPPRDVTNVYIIPLPGHTVTFGTGAGSGAYIGSMTARYTWSGGPVGGEDLDSGATVPQTANVTFTAPDPVNPANFFAYEWKVGDNVVRTDRNPVFTHTDIQGPLNVTVTLVEGFTVQYTTPANGTISASIGNNIISSSATALWRAGSTVVFTASPPSNFHVLEYIWRDGTNVVRRTPHTNAGSTSDVHTITSLSSDININVELVRGHTVQFDYPRITASVENHPTRLHPAESPVVFTAHSPASTAVMRYVFTNRLAPTGTLPLQSTGSHVLSHRLEADVYVDVEFDVGAEVVFGAYEGHALRGSVTAVRQDTHESITSGTVVGRDPPTAITFTATPIVNPASGNVYRVYEWFVYVNNILQPDLSPAAGTSTLTLTISESTTVRASFVPVTLELDADEVEVTGHGSAYINPHTIPIETNTLREIVIGRVTRNGETATLPAGLSVVVGSDRIVTINSTTDLSHHNNTEISGADVPFRVYVTDGYVEDAFEITIRLPFMYILDDQTATPTNPPTTPTVTIDNSNPSSSIYVYTNADIGGIGFAAAGLPGSDEVAFGVPFQVSTNRWRITITGTRPDVGNLVFDGTVTVSLGGISAPFQLIVNLTPPPRITSIEPTDATVAAFRRVSVQGIPPTTPLYAEFDVVGVNLAGENRDDVERSISAIFHQGPSTTNNWIGIGATGVRVTNITAGSATVRVPITATLNNPGAFRSGSVTITTNLPTSDDISGSLTVNQAGPITLNPYRVEVRNTALTHTVAVTGSGMITVPNKDSLPDEVKLYFDDTDAEENTIQIIASRPIDATIDEITITLHVYRDDLRAYLDINIYLTALDVPFVDWQNIVVDEATFGDLLGSVHIHAYNAGATFGAGVDAEHVPGTLKWYFYDSSVGDVSTPPQSHRMIFTPDPHYPVRFAPVTGYVPVIVNSVDPIINPWPTATAIFGQELSQATLTVVSATFNDVDVPGTFTWNHPTTPVGNAGSSYSHRLTFTPTGASAGNFNPVSEMIPVTVEKAHQDPPPAPSADDDDVTAVSITLQEIPQGPAGVVQFYMNTTGDKPLAESLGWQTETIFENLRPHTRYYFFARFPGDANHNQSDPSYPGTPIYTERAELRGTPKISGDGEPGFRYRDILTVNYSGLYAYADGSLGFDALDGITFQWYRNGSLIPGATGETYTLDYEDIGLDNSITVKVSAVNTERYRESDEIGPIWKRVPVAGDLVYSLTSVVFNGEERFVTVERDPNIIKEDAWLGSITVQYYWPTGSSSTPGWNTDRPINAGDYEVQVIIGGGTRYTDTTIRLGTFTIEKARPERHHLGVTLPGAVLNAEVGLVNYNGQPHSAIVTATSYPNAVGLGTTIAIYYYPVDGYDKPTRTAPTFPGTYQVTVSIAEGVNFLATENPISVGSFTIVGTNIPGITYLDETSFVFDGNNRGIVVTAEGSYVYFRDTDGVYRLTESPGIRNVGELTVHFVVTRPNTGYNRYYGDAKVIITPRQLTWDRGSTNDNLATVYNKIYDRTTTAAVRNAPTLSIGGIDGVVYPDNVTVSGDVNFAQHNVADTDIQVIATNWTIVGPDSGNYRAPVNQPLFANANINPRQLTWNIGSASTPATVHNKVYDGDIAATIQNAPTLSTVGNNGVIHPDNVTVVGGIAEFEQSSVGENITVTGRNWGIGGDDIGNYLPPAQQPIFAPASITQLPIDEGVTNGSITIEWPDDPPPVFTGSPLTPVPIVRFNGNELTHGTDFTLGGWQNNVNAGSNTASVTITGIGRFTDTVVSDFTIARATFADIELPRQVQYTDTDPNPQTVNIAELVADFEPFVGTPRFDMVDPPVVGDYPNIIELTTSPVTAGLLTFTIPTGVTRDDVGKSAIIPVIVSDFQNWNPITVNVNVELVALQVPTVKPNVIDSISYGQPLSALTIRATATVNVDGVDVDVPGHIAWTDPTQVLNAGLHTPLWTFTPNDTDNFAIVPGTAPITVARATPIGTVTADPPTITEGGSTLGDVALSGVFTNPNRGEDVPGSVSWDLPLATEIEQSVAFAWTFTPDDTANFNTATGYITLWEAPSGPPGNGGVPGPDPGNGSGSGNGNGNGSPGPGPGPTPQRTSFRVTILNSPSGISVPIGQSDSVRTFEAGMSVPLVAGTREGFAFSNWESNSQGVVFNNSNSANTSFTMPSNDVIITANWTDLDTPPDPTPPRPGSFSVIIENTPSDGAVPFGQSLSGRTFEEGTIVSLAAGTRDGFSFNNWYSNSSDIVFNNADNAYTIFTMPSNDAVFDSADNAYTSLTIPPNDIVFNSSNSVYISFIMPSNDVVLTANWIPAQFQVTIFNSPNGGAVPIGQSDSVRMFEAGAHVPLVAGTMEGFWFVNWGSISAGVVIDDASSASTGFTMPSNNVMIVANWGEGEEPPQPDPTPPPPDPTPPPPDPTPSPPSPTPAPPPGPGGESGNGHGSDDQDLVPKPGDGEDGDADVTQRGGFLPWLRVNLWWLSLILGAAILTVFWWFIIGRKRRKKEAIALPAEVTDLTAQQ